ncbi:hypothetical protein HNQ56_001392 [Anaerotaenia torta]|uniref:DUF5696 domain-containing protein n=1 Tax=Anaerotaenia torta TaxID=433293 RepID=UPI003D1B692D
MKKGIIAVCLLIALGLITGFALLFTSKETGSSKQEATDHEAASFEYVNTELNTPSGSKPGTEHMKFISENDTLEMYANTMTGEVAVVIKDTGEVWFTNPIDALTDEAATPGARKIMASQLILTYHDKKAVEYTINSYEECIENQQLKYKLTETGIEFQYVLGEFEESIIIPRWISEERMLQFLDMMDDEDRKFVKRQYKYMSLAEIRDKEKAEYLNQFPVLAEHPIYVLRDNSEYRQIELMEIFDEHGYTREDMTNDNEVNGYTTNRSDPYFVIPLQYILDEEQLLVTIDSSRIEYDNINYPLADISVLQYFGAAKKGNEGYMFVPDGSGALISFDSGMKNTPQYQQTVYGRDLAYRLESELEADYDLMIKMPVFGMKINSSAFLAIIEEGDALATLYANVSGKTDSYNYVNSSFRYLPYGQVSFSGIMSENDKLYMYADQPYQGNISLCYCFLSGADADYSGMASAYRDYLVDRKSLLEDGASDQVPFYLETVGAVNLSKKFFGVGYHKTEALTTYGQAAELVNMLRNDGISNIILNYSGWYNGGLKGTSAIHLSEVNALGTREDLNKLLELLNTYGLRYYFDVDLQYVYQDKWFDGYNASKWSPKYIDKSTVFVQNFDISNGRMIGKEANLIRIDKMDNMINEFMKSAAKLPYRSLNIGTLANTVYSDFTQNMQYNRQNSLEVNRDSLQSLMDNGYKLMGENAAVYSLFALEDIVKVPMYSNNYSIITKEVPFYEMVIHGCIDYAGEIMNQSSDYKTTFLKSIETGAGLYSQWIYEPNSILKETDFDYLYSVNYKSWYDETIKMYQRMNEDMASLMKLKITDHEEVMNGVKRTTYENGISTIVNYNISEVVMDGITIPARDYAVIGGAE